MKSFLSFGLLAAGANANIIFNWVQPTCDYNSDFSACLRGQQCTVNNTYAPLLSCLLSPLTPVPAAKPT